MRFSHLVHKEQTAFTLLEVLIVLAILGIIATVVIINVPRASVNSHLNVANTEVAHVKKAAAAFAADNDGEYPESSTELAGYFSVEPVATYEFDASGHITDYTPGTFPTSIRFIPYPDEKWEVVP